MFINKIEKDLSNSNYIGKIFNKNRNDVSLEDIREYFKSPQEETSVIEFKSGGVEIIDLYKEITAFLNTEGGLLIIGSPREKKETIGKNKKVICKGELTYSRFKNKDWLYQKIATNIVPTPVSIKINEYFTENGTIFLIDIPQSLDPPHQCVADGRYYIRLERDAKPAPHGIVQALFDKRKKSNLTADINFKKIDNQSNEISVSIKNLSRVPADKVSFLIDVYNIEGIDTRFKFRKDEYGDKFSISESSDQVLVRVVSIPIKFRLRHLGKEFMVFVGFWSKDSDFDFIFWTIDPIKNVIVSEGTFLGGTLYNDELKRIQT